ncbi:MAG: prepilin-type N-terminal cleavage/methylation domain-containing protein [Planctomycetota bacterium]
MNCSARHPARHCRSESRHGFTLTEVLIALGILAVGITSVASLFPPAILMQKETVRDVLGQQNVRSLDALLRAKALDGSQVFRFTDNLTAATDERDEVIAGSSDISYDNVNGAAAARGQWIDGTPPPALERWIIAQPEFDLYALAEIDAYTPQFGTNAIDFVHGPSTPGFPPNTLASNEAIANYQFPDMRPLSRYGTLATEPQSDPAKVSYAAHQSMLAAWGDLDRSFPSYVADPRLRELFVVPLIQRGAQASEFSSDYRVYCMLLEKREADIEDFRSADTDPFPAEYPDFGALSPEAQNAIVCANPFDSPDYFPKVFRLPAVDSQLVEGGTPNPLGLSVEADEIHLLVPNNNATLGLLVRPGDLMLGDDGDIYRAVGFPDPNNLSRLRVAKETRQSTAGLTGIDSTLRAVWIGLRPTGTAESPLRDIRILSQNVVRTLPQ